MTVDLARFSSALSLGEDGIWHGPTEQLVSYPADGNLACLALEEQSFWFRHRNRCICAAVDRFRPAGPLFDIGGGNGHVSGALSAIGVETVLVEPGIDGARAARQRGLRSVACSSMASACFHSGSLPAVGLFDVVEHIEQDLAFMAQVADALCPGGRVFLTVPAYRWLWSDEDLLAGHFRRYSRRSLVLLLQRAGLVVDFVSYFFRWLPAPVFLFRTVPSWLGWRGRRAQPSLRRVEHAADASAVRLVLEAALAGEAAAIAAGRSCGIGASLLVVARHPVHPASAGAS